MITSYQTNVRAQYEALGQFVESFEKMVDDVREICIQRIGSGGDERLAEIAFHHQAMTAKPLFDIMRAILAHAVNHHADRALFRSVLGRIEREYSHLYNKRNELLHGTWFIGYSSQKDPDAAEFYVKKLKTSADGLVGVKDLPKNAHELTDLANACSEVRIWLGEIDRCIQDNLKLTDVFNQRNDEWVLAFGDNERTLPKR